MNATPPTPFLLWVHEIEDPKDPRGVHHWLSDMLCLTICACIGGVNTLVGTEEFGKDHEAWFAQWLELPHGIPSHGTWERVMGLLDPEAVATMLTHWLQDLRRVLPGEVVALDGKTLRRSHDAEGDIPALHTVSAWATAQGLALGQMAVEDKSNEITALPRLLQRLEVTGCLVTIDAMGCPERDGPCDSRPKSRLSLGGQAESARFTRCPTGDVCPGTGGRLG